MVHRCMGLCQRDRPSQLKLGYKSGQVWCKVCNLFIVTDEIFHKNCCGSRFRRTSRTKSRGKE